MLDHVNRWALQHLVDGRWITVHAVTGQGTTLQEAQTQFAPRVERLCGETRIAAFRQHSVTGHPSTPVLHRASVA